MPYILAVEKLAGIEVPDRYVYPNVGAMTPVFFAFTDRQKVYNVIEAITGFRMHPAWFAIGGVAHDLPRGWDKLLRELLDWSFCWRSVLYQRRSVSVGVTGAGLRATGVDFDVRKWRPYSGYENFEFDIPIAHNGDCYDRVMIKVEEMRQSIRILEQCLKNMPEGPFKADHPLTTPPQKSQRKGINSYYLTSDGSTMSYRTRIRTPSYEHLQQIPAVIRGSLVSDLIVYLGSIDFVMSDVDR
ncbi:hypothetical protein DOY81_015451 [Sarcophaga bullata]|nr:hypothetical protein DOY81_015451 [Sarcophaga bullata]